MIIEETECLDSLLDSSNASKILLADQLIEAFTPLFSEEIEESKQRLKNSKSDYLKLKKISDGIAIDLKNTIQNISNEKKKQAIIEEIEGLLSNNILFGKNKEIVTQILLSLDSLGDSELSKCYSSLKRMTHQYISRVIKK